MPLVTRTGEQGTVYKSDSQPSNWQDGDIWSDTSANVVYNNVSGTATLIGKSSFSESATTSYSQTIPDYTSPTAAVASSDTQTTLLSLTAGSTDVGLTASSVRGFGNKIGASHSLVGKTVKKLTMYLKNAMTGTATFGVWNSSNTLVFTFGTLDLSTITGSYVAYTKTNLTGYTIASGDVIGVFFSGSNTTTNIRRANTNVDANITGYYPSDAQVWSIAGDTQDCDMILIGGTGDGANSVYDGSTSTYWSSNSEANPRIYVDCGGSATNILGYAIYLHANTTETELAVRASTDTTFTSGENTRTITVSNLTAGAWNYIRCNLVNVRYLQFYGNSGASKVLAISELKYLTKTDSQILQDLAIIEISGTDTTLALDGT
jgi:hypothetical protein